jgi:putative MFS transporter
VLGPEFRKITLALCYSGFVLNFLFYGGLYAFPQIFADLETTTSAAMNLIIGALWELPSLALAILVGTYRGRKPSMIGSLFVNTIALGCFGWAGHTHKKNSTAGAKQDDAWMTELILHVAYYGIKIATEYTFILFYVYASEVYPTEVRATGSAANMAFGRLGSMFAPMIFEHMHEATGGFRFFFYVSAVLSLINLCCIVTLPETFGRKLRSGGAGKQREAHISLVSDQIEMANIATPATSESTVSPAVACELRASRTLEMDDQQLEH